MPKRPRTRHAPGPRDHEEFVFAGGSFVRDGRFISMQSTADAAQHAAFVSAALARIPEVDAHREQALARLQEVLTEVGPADCVAFVSLTYLQKNPDTYRESEDDRSAAHVEFLALQALAILGQPGTAPAHRLPELANEALHQVREAFDDTKELLALHHVEASRAAGQSALDDYRHEALAEGLVVRGSAYAEHTQFVLNGLFRPFDDDCLRVIGFTAQHARQLIEAIPVVIGARLDPRLEEARGKYARAVKDLKRLRRKGSLPPEVDRLTPTQQQRWLRRVIMGSAYDDPLSLARLTAVELAAAAGVPTPSAAAWLELMHCPTSAYVDAYHRVPVGGHPLTRKPLLKVEDGYLAPAPSALLEAMRPQMEDAMRARNSELWGRYEAHRGRWVEATATDRLRTALPGASSWTGIKWTGANDDSDLDGLVHTDDLALRIQGKAGRISDPARRGAPSMIEDLTAVVSDAMHQHARLTRALSQQPAAELGFTTAQAAALSAPLQIEVVVCLDDVTVWATETHKLRQLVSVPDTDQVPWVLSLCDLMATTDLLSGAELAHFLTRRQRLEREARIEAHDELDWVGHYLSDGLFFDAFFDNPKAPDILGLTSYTEAIDSWYLSRAGMTTREFPKPTQPLPTGLAGLIERLEHDRPKHWLTAAMFLLNGDDFSRTKIAEAIDHTIARAAEVGWSNASQAFTTYGVTLWADRRGTGAEFDQLLVTYADQKIAELQRPNWIVVGLGADSKLTVIVRETDPAETLVHALLRRVSSAADTTEAS